MHFPLMSVVLQKGSICIPNLNRAMKNVASLNLELATQEDISAIETHLKEQVGLDDTFGYKENLVTRKEIYALKESNVIIDLDNIASRKAIERSGFYSSSIIFDISFIES